MSTASCRRSRSPSSFTPKASATSIWSRKIPTPIRRPTSRRASRPRIATNSTPCRRPAQDQGRLGDRVRADLRRRKAPPPQARHDGRSGAPRDDQSGRLRRLRRLLGAVELHFGRAAGNRDGPQAHHQPVDLQQGLFLPEGLLPVLRHHRRRQAAPPRAGRASAISAICRSRPRGPRWSGPTTSRSAASAAPAC